MKGWKSKTEFKREFTHKAHILWGKNCDDLTKGEVYQTLALMVRDLVSDNWIRTNDTYTEHKVKQVYYFSVEFLLGRLLQCNLINTGMEELCRAALDEMGWKLDEIIPEEPDAGLGNGGLGRLAACFIDSMASLSLPGHGCSIRYQYGLFDQRIIDGQQAELPDNWLRNGCPWEIKRSDKAVDVRFGGNAYMRREKDGKLICVHEGYTPVHAIPYDIPVIGYKNNTVNSLRLWHAEYTREAMTNDLKRCDLHEAMRRREMFESISRFLYPDDSTYEGRQLRLMQEYFFVSAGLQSIVRHFKKNNGDLRHMDRYIALHINDTHPALIIPELMRILMDENDLSWDEAWNVTQRSVAYTNHTVMPEALEKWSIDMFKRLLPRVYAICEEIHNRWMKIVRKRYPKPEDEDKVRQVAILWDGQIFMANLAVLGSHSVNGVAEIHSGIVRNDLLREFANWFPERFNNKTNGVTHRRWLMAANPQLSSLLDETIGTAWRTDPERLNELERFAGDSALQKKLADVKRKRKEILAAYVKRTQGLTLNVDSIFDVQVKRIHMYKRQLLNILHVYYEYLQLLAHPELPYVPKTYFFGGKAAQSYGEAKLTIHLICETAQKINNDPRVKDLLKVVFLENYNVSLGQLVYPAAEISEQISTAGKEASGTGNMKFMMNGAITLGTLDGANVEIHREVGDENCIIFGLRAEEVMNYYRHGGYSSWDLYSRDADIHELMDALGRNDEFRRLYDALLDRNDEYFLLKDFKPYCAAQKEASRRYLDSEGWQRSSAVNIARSGYFSSDRTIREYAEEIWHLRRVRIGH